MQKNEEMQSLLFLINSLLFLIVTFLIGLLGFVNAETPPRGMLSFIQYCVVS